jgi:hypothetical protein
MAMSDTISEADANQMREQIQTALRAGFEQDDAVIMILVHPPLLQEFHRLWNEWDIVLQVGGDSVHASEFVTIADSDQPIAEQRYALVTRSQNETNFLRRHYSAFLESMKHSPVQVTVEDLHRLYIQDRMQELRGEDGQDGK